MIPDSLLPDEVVLKVGALPGQVRLDAVLALNWRGLPDPQASVGRLCLGFAGDVGQNCHRSTAGMDCLWDTSGCVRNSRPPCGNHLENYWEKER